MSVEDIKNAIRENPSAKAVFVNNPTYYGVCSNLKEIVKVAHSAGMLVIVDEAHGTHFYFGEDMPLSAMDAGADISAISVHKTGGSLTQSSMLLIGDKVDAEAMRQTINLTQTTSGSYLLMISLDIARKNLFLNGKDILKKVVPLLNMQEAEINKIGGLKFSSEIINGDTAFAFD